MTTNQTTAVAKAQPKPIDTVRAALDKMKTQFALVLPKHITPERMVRVALTAIQNTPKLLECDKQSLYSAVMRAAQLGLEPDGILGQAYLIPYAGKVQFIPGYKGLIDLARRSGEVSNIIAREVCANDEFTVDFSQEVPFVHKPKLDGDRGKVTHFWASARFKDCGFHWDYLTVDEVLAIRDASSGWKQALKYAKRDKENNLTEVNSPWFNHFNEMGKKTAIRRIAKYLPMSVQKAAAAEDLIDAGKSFSVDQMGDLVIEGDNAEVIDNGEGGSPASLGQSNASKLDQFASHDPETGEILEQKAAGGEAAPGGDSQTAHRPTPDAIPMPTAPGDATQPDVGAWSEAWEQAVASAPDVAWLKDLMAKNKTVLASFAKRNPDKHRECVSYYDEMMAALGGKAAA